MISHSSIEDACSHKSFRWQVFVSCKFQENSEVQYFDYYENNTWMVGKFWTLQKYKQKRNNHF